MVVQKIFRPWVLLRASTARAFVALQYILPQHAVSRLIFRATRVKTAWFKNALIRVFLKFYPVNMDEAAQNNPLRFANFNEFFTRALKAHLRPVDADRSIVVSPVDGTISECGTLDQDRMVQAKNQYYSLHQLLADQPWAAKFVGGSFATIYLAPFNYHRIHMPIRGKLLATVYVPGRLFSVNSTTARYVEGLFARNERVLTVFESDAGMTGLVLVGALNVGSITTVWAGDIAPSKQRVLRSLPQVYQLLEKGAEMGRFNMGSTVILLFEPGRIRWNSALVAGCKVQFGQPIGHLLAGPAS